MSHVVLEVGYDGARLGERCALVDDRENRYSGIPFASFRSADRAQADAARRTDEKIRHLLERGRDHAEEYLWSYESDYGYSDEAIATALRAHCEFFVVVCVPDEEEEDDATTYGDPDHTAA